MSHGQPRMWVRQCVWKNIRAGMERAQAAKTCTGKLSQKDDLQQVSTKRKKGPLAGADADQRGSPAAAASSSPGSGGGEFGSASGVTFGQGSPPRNAGGQAPTGRGVGTGNSTGAGGMTPSYQLRMARPLPIQPLIAELRKLLRS
jgi:hypothetical protein